MGESATRAIKCVGRIQKEREEGAEHDAYIFTWGLLPERLQRPPSIRSTNKFRPQFKAIG